MFNIFFLKNLNEDKEKRHKRKKLDLFLKIVNIAHFSQWYMFVRHANLWVGFILGIFVSPRGYCFSCWTYSNDDRSL